ncbi:MAG TPA: hypothetical protein VFY45_23415 [Baekduia sp.]|nr:hypothetical protein [Baekduia sp.]
MQTVTILRQLWRRRVATALIALVSVVAGVLVVSKVSLSPLHLESRKYDVGIATARILVDTPESQVVDVSPRGSDTLGIRANLLANLMVDGVVKSAIAKRAGLAPNAFYGVAESATDPAAESPPKNPREAMVLRTKVLMTPDGDRMPIIEIEAQAPGTDGARKLADASISGLSDYLNTKAAQDHVADARRLRVSGLGVAQARMAPRGPRLVYGLAAALLLFLAGCTAMLGGSRLIQAFRAAGRDDARRAAEADTDERWPSAVPSLEPEPSDDDDPSDGDADRSGYTRKRLLRGNRAS